MVSITDCQRDCMIGLKSSQREVETRGRERERDTHTHTDTQKSTLTCKHTQKHTCCLLTLVCPLCGEGAVGSGARRLLHNAGVAAGVLCLEANAVLEPTHVGTRRHVAARLAEDVCDTAGRAVALGFAVQMGG